VEFDAFADEGGTNLDNTKDNLVGLMGYGTRSIHSARPIWGANFGVTYGVTNTSNIATALELDIGSVDADDSAQHGAGLRIINGGAHKAGVALQINGSGSTRFYRGIGVNNYSEAGIFMQATGSRTADILIVPPADDQAPAFVIRNHGNSLNRFSIDDSGDVSVSGSLSVSGVKHFKIDHPLDPANKYLNHSSVESSDMMNIYNGNVVLDEKGEAVVQLQDWFEALNREFRYQLTSVGEFQQLYIAEEISGNHFRIAGGKPHGKVSWQVTGVRHDAYAETHRIPVEEEKKGAERGTYLHPELFEHPDTLASDLH
jgi:hypothetical protein